jgi:carbamoyltransferase
MNKGVSCNGKVLADGAIAYFEDDVLKALIMEERVTGKLRKGGFEKAFLILKKKYHIDIADIDHIGVSTCTEPVGNSIRGLDPFLETHKSILPIEHHYSHAYGTFALSGFDRALVVVIDGGGNVLPDSNNPNNPNWWEEPREQHSYYIADKDNVTLIERDFDEKNELGFGELYRAATYFMCFKTSRKAANIMALASYGDYKNIPNGSFIDIVNGKMVSSLKYDYSNPSNSFKPLFNGKFHLEPLAVPPGNLSQYNSKLQPYYDFCAYIQWNIEQALIKKLKLLKAETTTTKVCITGGSALNCVMNAKILEEEGLFEDVYVPFVPGDHGQSLGNALVVNNRFGKRKSYSFCNTQNAFLGLGAMDKLESGMTLERFVAERYDDTLSIISYGIADKDSVANGVALLLSKKYVVLTCVGRSEAGYRALGNRSVLANAFDSDALNYRKKIQALKNREWFRPYAPAILDRYFKRISGRDVKSPFMSLAVNVNGFDECFGECKSKDNRARIQTVNEESFVGQVLSKLEQMGEQPICLNTSFNSPGKPIVETIEDAFAVFCKCDDIYFLATDGCIIYKKGNSELDTVLVQLQKCV